MTWKKAFIIGLAVVLVAAAVGVGYWRFRKTEGPTVNVETIRKQNLEAVVSASGKIQASDRSNQRRPHGTRGQTRGERGRSRQGRRLPPADRSTDAPDARSRGEVAGGAQRTRLQAAREAVETARVSLAAGQQTLTRQQDLWKQQLTTREAARQGPTRQGGRVGAAGAQEQQSRRSSRRSAGERADLDRTRYDLSKVTIESPIDGIVTRRNIEEGETAVMGTMNKPARCC